MNYPTMSTKDIANLPVSAIAADDAALALWVPSTLLEDGLMVMKSWGFEYKTNFVWVKTTKEGWVPTCDDDLWLYEGEGEGLGFGMGRYFRGCHEMALFGIRGRPTVYSRSERSVSLAYNQGHSVKPDTLHRKMERMFPGPYLELFARRLEFPWVCVGNEIDGRDIRFALSDMLL